ncbi:hypothetical protein FQV27_05315 [Paracoccus aurantiacus]|uniref:Uncharacterized protein n=1 Tax=Paracoccus aurantiacus TaxID=2599412 RepID=A0A5C6S8T0_9RHOB|nr:hypothetical protein [Paracoccus aurantiacus]TXB71259.1 hypothetical protein FQV27_05315 [Paracoccus aurantiacus]
MTPPEPAGKREPTAAGDAPRGMSGPGVGGVCLASFLSLLLLLLVALNHGTERAARLVEAAPPRPDGVPAEAVFQGRAGVGYFVTLTKLELPLADGRRLLTYKVGAWDSVSGEPAYLGPAILVPDPAFVMETPSAAIQPAADEILKSLRYANGAFSFDMSDGGLSGRIVPLRVKGPTP